MKSRWRSGWEEHSDPACGPLELPEPGSWGVEDLRVLLLLKRTRLSPSRREARVSQWNRINDTYCVGTASACCDKKDLWTSKLPPNPVFTRQGSTFSSCFGTNNRGH